MKIEDLETQPEDFAGLEHEQTTDGTGMYPLKKPIHLKTYLAGLMLPAALIHVISFWGLYSFLRHRSLEHVTFLLACSIPPLLLSSLYLLLARRDDIKRIGRRYFSRYERGRRFVIGLVISWAASGAWIYYVVERWQILSLPAGTMLLAAALLCGNVILTRMTYELASYIMFGILTWLIGVVSFTVCHELLLLSPLHSFKYNWLIAQVISFVLCVLFAFITNRVFVFSNKGNFWMDMVRFFGSRIVSTLAFEVAPMHILIDWMHVDDVIAKFVGAFLVTIANYFLSKFFVFRGRGELPEDPEGGL